MEGSDMKKAYATPVAEKIEFRYNDQIAASGSDIPALSCTQNWIGLRDDSLATCSHTVAIPDSGF